MQKMLDYFKEISSIPRCSGNEEKIVEYLISWAESRKLKCFADENKNLVIYVEALKPTDKSFALQSHTDMVCEKRLNSKHDFSADPIRLVVDGDFISAKDTSLGADNGIGMALAMAVSEDVEVLNNTNLELVFTSDEETGLNGAKLIRPGLINSSKLINLDAESEREIIVGCAGGVDIIGNKNCASVILTSKDKYKLTVDGLTGGHSGIDIHKNRLNAIKVLADLLLKLGVVNLGNLLGGTRHNAIPRSAYAVFSSDKDEMDIRKIIDEHEKRVRLVEEDAHFILEKVEDYSQGFLSISESSLLLNMIVSMPNGVDEVSDSQVVTSSNLAIFGVENGLVDILISVRSSYKYKKDTLAGRLLELLKKCGFKTESKNEYPAWEPDFDSTLLKVAKEEHLSLFKREPQVKVIHAGLECGILMEKYPHLQAISIGPDIFDPHSPSERVSISSLANVYSWLKMILINAK